MTQKQLQDAERIINVLKDMRPSGPGKDLVYAAQEYVANYGLLNQYCKKPTIGICLCDDLEQGEHVQNLTKQK